MHKQCTIYDQCGGCHYQHLTTEKYRMMKQAYFEKAFSQFKLDPTILKAPIFIAEHTRRRTSISFYNDGQKYVWGYKQEKSHKIISAPDCIIVTAQILSAINALPPLIKPLVKPNVQVKAFITEAKNGLDIHIKGLKAPKSKDLSDFNTHFFQKIPSAIRLTINHNIMTQIQTPVIDIDGLELPLPLECFLQPSVQGQECLIQEVINHVGKISKKKKIIDLFCGLGTFTIPLTKHCSVSAYDNAGEALNTLKNQQNFMQFGARLDVHKRDLFRDPVSFLELKKYDIAIIDPPRAGAEAQIRQIAQSNIKKIIYVFCNPNSAARDIEILMANNYKIKSLIAIDQFIYSKHIEGIALIEN